MLNKCLGRKPAVHDPRTVKLTDLAPSMQYYNPLHECLRASEVATWLMGDNDRYGDCTSVGIANTLLARSIFAGHTNPPTTADILSFYERFGFIPGDPATDQGATLIECIQSWMSQGYPVRGTANKLLGYASIDPHNPTLMHAAIEIFGDVYIGVTLDEAQQTQTTWDYVAGSATWGGHCISCNAFDSNGLYRVTSWAEWLPVTKNFMDQQCDEAYVLLDAASIRKGQMTFSDWNMAALEAAIKSLGGLDTSP